MRKLIYSIVGIIVVISLAGWGAISQDETAKKLNLKIEKDHEGIWRVRDLNGNNKGTLKVNHMDRISWQAKHSDMVFTFEKNVNDYFEFDEGLFRDGKTQAVDMNKKLDVTLKESAPGDTLVYQVYVVDADTFVIGHSPPVIIIMR